VLGGRRKKSNLVCAASLIVGLLHITSLNACPFDLPVWNVEVNGQTLQLEIADSREARQCGLSKRTSMAQDHGMLFIFPHTMPVAFWMHDTQLALSIAFLDENGGIVDIQTMTPGQDKILYKSPGPVLYAIEVNRDWFSNHRVHAGDIVHMPDLTRRSHDSQVTGTHVR